MSLLLLRRRVAASARSSNAVVPLTIRRFDGQSGEVLVSNAIPLPKSGAASLMPADVANGYGVLRINGVEQTIAIRNTKTRHNSGAVASVLVQLTLTLEGSDPLEAEWLPRQRRTLPTVSVVDVDSTMAAGRAAALPTDPTYLCGTDCTRQPMLPLSMLDAAEVAWYSTWFDSVQSQMETAWTDQEGSGAWYQVARAYFSHWCMTGDPVSWYKGARFIERLKRTVYTSITNGETISMSLFDLGIGYTLTGYEPYWEHVGRVSLLYGGLGPSGIIYASQEAASYPGYNAGAAIAGAVGGGSSYGMRFNCMYIWPALAAFSVQAKKTDGSWTSRLNGGANLRFDLQLPYRIQAFIDNAYAKGDHRDGMTGQLSNFNVAGEDKSPTFWLSVINNVYRDYYHMVIADSRIPGLIKTNVDIMLAQCIAPAAANIAAGATHGIPYWFDADDEPDGVVGDSVLFTMFAADLAFLSRFYPEVTSNGATYLQWYYRAIKPGNVLPVENLAYNRWKNFGEALGWNYSGPFHRSGMFYSPPSTIREPDTNN